MKEMNIVKKVKSIFRRTLSVMLTLILVLGVAVGVVPAGITASAIPVPEGYLSAKKITAGSGTQSDPYLIATKEEFFSLTDVDLYSNYYGGIKYFKITEDIDFGGYYFDKSIIGSHYIDGNGKTLNNIYMLAGVSLFTSFNEIKNITLSNMTSTAPLVADDFRIGRIDFLTIANGHFVGFRLGGIIADRITNEFDDVSVTNCHIVNTTYDLSTGYIEDYFAGGLFGEVVIATSEYEITIKGNTISKSKLSIEAGAPISFGGIAGRIYSLPTYGVNDYTEDSKIYIPLDFSNNVIAQCEMWVYNPISGVHGDYKINNIGGIVGSIETSRFRYFTLKSCHNYGGVIYSDTVDEIWENNVIEYAQPGALGGIVGKIDMGNVTVSMCSNNTDLKDFSTIGGIVGIKRSGCELVIEQCYNRGDILLEKSISYTHRLEDGEYLYYSCTSVPISHKTDFSCGFGGIIGACQTQTSIDKKTAIYDCVNFGNIKGYKAYNAIEIPKGGIVGSVEINALSYFEVERCYTTGKFTNAGSDERVDMHIGFTFDGYADIALEADIYDAHSLSLHMLYYEDTTKPAEISADYGSAVTDDYIFTDLAEDYNYDVYATAWRIPFDGAASSSNYQTEIYPIPAALCNYATACPYDFADFGTGDPFYADDYFETGFGFATLGEAVLHTQSGYWSEQGYLNPYIFV